MEKMMKCIEVRSSDGKLILSFLVTERELTPESKPATQANQKGKGQGEGNASKNSQRDDEAMTDAQKRYLFRLLADLGKEGDAAYQYLKTDFGVEALIDVTKQEASRMINRLLEELKGGE